MSATGIIIGGPFTRSEDRWRCGAVLFMNGSRIDFSCGHRLLWAGHHESWCDRYGDAPTPQGQSVDEWVFDLPGGS